MKEIACVNVCGLQMHVKVIFAAVKLLGAGGKFSLYPSYVSVVSI